MTIARLYKCEVQIPAAQVGSGGVSDYTITLTEDSFIANASDFLDADGAQAPQGDLGDLIATTDEAGTNRIAVDVISVSLDNNPALSTVLLSIGTASLSSASLNSIWLWWGHADSQSQPAAAAAFGQYASYESALEGYWPMEETVTSGAPNESVLDRTDGQHHGAAETSLVSETTTAKIGKSIDTNSDSNSGIPIPDNAAFQPTDCTMMIWCYPTNLSANWYGLMTNKHSASSGMNIQMGTANRSASLIGGANHGSDFVYVGTGGASESINQWYHLAISHDADPLSSIFYRNGVQKEAENNTQTLGYQVGGNNYLQIGMFYNEDSLPAPHGYIDQARFWSRPLSAADVQTYYNNENAPGTFAVAQTVQSAVVVVTAAATDTLSLTDTATVQWFSGYGTGIDYRVPHTAIQHRLAPSPLHYRVRGRSHRLHYRVPEE